MSSPSTPSSPSTDDPAPTTDHWEGFTHDEALAWSYEILRFLPRSASAAILGAASSSHAAGRPPAGRGWADRARTAIALGFTPTSFAAWRTSLTRVPAGRYAAHPHNHTVDRPFSLPGHTFDAEVWAGWPFLLTHGVSPEAATHYALLRAEELDFDPAESDAYSLSRSHRDQYDEALARRRASYGIDQLTTPQKWADSDWRTRDRLRRDRHESTQAFRERSIRDHAEAQAAHARDDIRIGYLRARKRWADARLRAAQLRASVTDGSVRQEDRRKRL